MNDDPTQHPDDVRQTLWGSSQTDEATLSPHRVSDRSEAAGSSGGSGAGSDGADTAWIAPSASAAADQPHAVKARQRRNVAESRPAERTEKPRNPTTLTKAAWGYSLRRAVAEFSRNQSTDLAAGLTYYAVLSIFPALIGLVSILSLLGEADRVMDFFMDTLAELVDPSMLETAEMVLEQVMSAPGAGFALVIGVLTSLWTASNYVNAFSRAMNRLFEVEEGRPFLKLRPLVYLITLVLIVMIAAAALLMVTSGPIAEAVGETVGLGETALFIWQYAQYPVMLLVAAAVVALLYCATPNVKQPGISWVSTGAVIAIVVMLLATAGLGLYLGSFADYHATYGALAGVIIGLFWIYVINVVLLFGAVMDAELERARQLQAGMPSERTLLLPTRDDSGSEKKAAKYEELVRRGEALRLSGGETSDPEDLWRR